jgi:L-asparaginase/Glu-tRNA(Gln) amidotransferase subunit D
MLRAAFVATQGERLPEVVVAFNDLVLRAVRTEKVDDFRFSAFAAPSEGPLAVIGETLQFQLPVRSGGLVGEWNLAPAFEEQVLKISQYPGLNVKYILRNLESGDVRGLLIESLGLGNIPVVEGYSLIPAIQKAQDLRIPVLITGRYPIQPEFIEFYKPASQPLQLGAISAGDMAPPAALTKFMWAIAQVDAAVQRRDLPPNRRLEQVKKIMETNLLGEVGTSRSRKQ